MTKKQTMRAKQEEVNRIVLEAYNDYIADDINNYYFERGKRLRYCSAEVIKTDYGFALKSYSTFIAFIDDKNHTCYDFLRYVYGYTSTSAQHIAKFIRDYHAEKCYSYR